MVMKTLHLTLRGTFSARTHDGRDVTPKSKKAVGMLALIAECATQTRSRRWLEDKLWSDRAPEQARGSLRQTLCEIRKSLGGAADVLASDRSSVWLETARVSHDLQDAGSDREFLEGLDISDPEFNDWLIEMRQVYPACAQTRETGDDPRLRRQIKIQCGLPWSKKSDQGVLSQIVDDQVGKILSEFLVASRCSSQEANADLVVRTSVHEEHGGSAVYVQVIDPKLDELVHSDHCFTNELNDFLKNQDALGRFCWNLADRALEKLPDLGRGDSAVSIRAGFVQSALRAVLSFEESRMRESLRILDTATAYVEDGLFYALRAWAMTSMIMEEFIPESRETLDEIRHLLRRASEISPDDSMCCAVVANVQVILLEDSSGAMLSARRALRDNPNNLFALQAMSSSRALCGDFDAAYSLSKHSKTVSSLSKFEPMCNLHHALLCLNMRRSDEALASSRLAADYAPSYRAPKRQLIALYASNNQPDKAMGVIKELKRIEHDFSVERFLFDRRYPTNTLRASGYLAEANSVLARAGHDDVASSLV